ncbi:hypothetical protein BHM03_00058133 [Ensete ventricosum]|nr:hypothetical protein BHM03_00058133 [Ensete ventricosum]
MHDVEAVRNEQIMHHATAGPHPRGATRPRTPIKQRPSSCAVEISIECKLGPLLGQCFCETSSEETIAVPGYSSHPQRREMAQIAWPLPDNNTLSDASSLTSQTYLPWWVRFRVSVPSQVVDWGVAKWGKASLYYFERLTLIAQTF